MSGRMRPAVFFLCAEHDQQLEDESPLPNRMEVNG